MFSRCLVPFVVFFKSASSSFRHEKFSLILNALSIALKNLFAAKCKKEFFFPRVESWMYSHVSGCLATPVCLCIPL